MFDFDDDQSSYLIAAAQLTALVFATRWLLATPKETAPAKKLHVDYGPAVDLPLPMKIIASLPDAIRIPLLIKSQAPTQPKDSIDILGTDEVDPYKKREILPGKIWGVAYKCITDPNLAKFMEMFLEGTKEERQAKTIENAPDHLKETLKQDFVRKDKYDQLSEVEKAKLGGDMFQEMFVIKLDNGLILYNPVRMHPQMVDWIKERGEVKYIVSGSSAHTNHLPASAATFPEAKIICASVADMKCQSAGMRPSNYLYDLRRDEAPPKKFEGRGTLQDAMESFPGNDVKLFHISGDNFTDTMFLLAHGHLFVLDLIYSSSEEWKKLTKFDTNVSIIGSTGRIMTYSLVSEKVKVRIVPSTAIVSFVTSMYSRTHVSALLATRLSNTALSVYVYGSLEYNGNQNVFVPTTERWLVMQKNG